MAEEEEEEGQDVGQQQGYHQEDYAYVPAEDMTHSITAAVPRIGELLEEYELGGYQPDEGVATMQGKQTGMDDPDVMASPPVMAGPGSMVGLASRVYPGVLEGGIALVESMYNIIYKEASPESIIDDLLNNFFFLFCYLKYHIRYSYFPH